MTKTRAPFLQRVETRPEKVDPARFPFTIRAFSHGIALDVVSPVTFFVGENGSGKSITRDFLNSRERFFKHLFQADERPG